MHQASYALAANVLNSQRRRSKGYLNDPVANPYDRILVGNCERITPEFIRDHRITHVINCAEDGFAPAHVKIPGRYASIGAVDTLNVHLFAKWYPAFKAVMDSFLRDPACQNVYVHCQAGINRSAFLTCGYLVKVFRVPLFQALSRMVDQRPCVMTNPAFLLQLVEFAKKSD